MRGFNVSLDGLEGTINRLKEKGRDVRIEVETEIQAAGTKTALNASINLSRYGGGLGNLLSSISADGSGLEVEIVAAKFYAPYVEFGTGERVKVPSGLEDYAMQFFVSGKGKMPARPYLFPAFFVQKEVLLRRIKEILKQPR